MSVEKNVPEIRFKGFNDEWANINIGVIFQVTSGATPLRSDARFFENADVSWVKTTDLNNGVILKTEEKISQIALAETSVKILPKGTVFVAMYGGFNQIGRTGLLETEATCNQALSAIYPNSKVVPYYLLTFLNLNVDAWKDLAASSRKDPNITKSDVLAFPFLYPSIKEQTAIGNIFQKLDNLINQHQQKQNKLSSIKKSMLEKMFPKQGETIPEIRFKGFSGEWKEVSLSDFGVATSGTSIESEFTKDGKYKVISIGSYSENSVYTEQGIRASLSPKTESRVLNKNDLTMILNDKTLAGNIIGRVLLVDEDDSYVYNQRTQRIEPSSEYNPQFLYQFLNAPSVRKRIFKASQGNTQIYVNWSAISKLKYFIPKKDEQIVIGNYFQKLDALINQHQQQITKLNNIKQASLHKMFV